MGALRTLMVVAVLGCIAAAGTVRGEAPDLEPFFGTYEGASLYQRKEAQARDLSVTIRPAGDGGFTIEWAATLYKREDEPQTRSQILTFQPTAPGAITFVAVPSGVSGAAEPSRDPLSGKPFAWARVLGRVLSVNILAIDANGDWSMQIYDRALTAEGLGLAYMRLDNGQVAHRVWGALQRVAE